MEVHVCAVEVEVQEHGGAGVCSGGAGTWGAAAGHRARAQGSPGQAPHLCPVLNNVIVDTLDKAAPQIAEFTLEVTGAGNRLLAHRTLLSACQLYGT